MTRSNVTLGVTSTGNLRALTMALSSVLLGSELPCRILLRLEGEFPSFGDFYLEQVSELARVQGVEFVIHVARSQGIRNARDFLLRESRTKLLWMLDDDVIARPECLSAFMEADRLLAQTQGNGWGYVNGTKPDLNNRRGYKDFSTVPLRGDQAKENQSYNQFYEGPGVLVRHSTADTGNLLINVPAVLTQGIGFNTLPASTNAGGEDTMFALQCAQKGLSGWFHTGARSYHLEKPETRFGEYAARKQYLLTEAARLGLPTSSIELMMPWVKAFQSNDSQSNVS